MQFAARRDFFHPLVDSDALLVPFNFALDVVFDLGESLLSLRMMFFFAEDEVEGFLADFCLKDGIGCLADFLGEGGVNELLPLRRGGYREEERIARFISIRAGPVGKFTDYGEFLRALNDVLPCQDCVKRLIRQVFVVKRDAGSAHLRLLNVFARVFLIVRHEFLIGIGNFRINFLFGEFFNHELMRVFL